MSMKALADEATNEINKRMETYVDSRCAADDDVRMCAMVCRIKELEESLTLLSVRGEGNE